MSIYSETEDAELRAIWTSLSGAARDTLYALIHRGPLWDGDVPSKSGRDELLRCGLASKAVVRREQGYQVANYKGWMVLRVAMPDRFESPHSLASNAIDIARKEAK